MRAQVYNASVPWPSLKPRCLRVWERLGDSLSVTSQLTVDSRFHLVERILYPGYPGGDVIHGEAPHQGQATYPFSIQLTENVPLSYIPLSHT